jgi:type I restriction enzyme, S subunit
MASEWQTIRLERLLAEPVRNGIYKPKSFHGRGAKIVNMGELFAHPRLRAVPMKRVELSESEAERFILASGDLLFARRSLVAEGAGKCSVVLDVNEPTTFEPSIIRARPDRTKAEPLYLYYFFNSAAGLHCLDTIRRQVAVAGITGSDLSRLEIPIPPLSEQRAIAHILGTLDDKIELNRRMNETLEAMARAIFKSWFVDFDPVRAKAEGCDPGLPKPISDLFPDRFEDSEVGEIPREWQVGTLAEEIEIIGGGTPKTSVPEYWGGDILWFSVVDAPASTDVWVIDTEKKITEAGLNNSSTQLLPKGTTIISARGTVGKCALVGHPMAMNQSCYGIRGKERCGNYYGYFSIRNEVSDLQQQTHGSVFNTITRTTFGHVDKIVPPIDMINVFDRTVEPLMARVLANLYEYQTLTVLRDTLLSKLLSVKYA